MKRYSIATGGENEPGLILVIDDANGIVVARSSDTVLPLVQHLVDLANRPTTEPDGGS